MDRLVVVGFVAGQFASHGARSINWLSWARYHNSAPAKIRASQASEINCGLKFLGGTTDFVSRDEISGGSRFQSQARAMTPAIPQRSAAVPIASCQRPSDSRPFFAATRTRIVARK